MFKLDNGQRRQGGSVTRIWNLADYIYLRGFLFCFFTRKKQIKATHKCTQYITNIFGVLKHVYVAAPKLCTYDNDRKLYSHI